MIWIILAFLGVPLWLCAAGILYLVLLNRKLRHRAGDIPLRLQVDGKGRWKRGHAVWVSDVLAFRSSPAGWTERLAEVKAVSPQAGGAATHHHFRGLGDDPVVFTFTVVDGAELGVAARKEHRAEILGPFAAGNAEPGGGLVRPLAAVADAPDVTG